MIEMAWEDRTPFEAIEHRFGLNQDGVIKLMRAQLKLSSFKMWRKRTHGQTTKHLKLRSSQVVRHQSREHNKDESRLKCAISAGFNQSDWILDFV